MYEKQEEIIYRQKIKRSSQPKLVLISHLEERELNEVRIHLELYSLELFCHRS